jgi:hypothetical protein
MQMTNTNPSLREQLITKLGLELTPSGQLIPSSLEDFQSDWTFTVDDVLLLIEAEKRKSTTFSVDGGKTHYDLDDKEHPNDK